MKFLIITPQTILQENKASTHFLIEELALRDDVQKIDVVTVNLSLIKLIKDKNYSHIPWKTIFKGFLKNKISNKFILFPIHFINLHNKILNKIVSWFNILFAFFFTFFLSKDKYHQYTHIIVVAGTPLILFNILKKLGYINNSTKIIYRVVDDLTTVNLNSEILGFEEKLDKNILVHTVNNELNKKYLNMGYTNVLIQNHAVDKRSIDNININPYEQNTINLVFVGMSMLDYDFLEIATTEFKDYDFWIIGPFSDTIKRKNIHFLGKLAFEETLKYIKFADIGLQTLSYAKNVNTLQNTLKFQQYKYMKLPIIMPEYIAIQPMSYGEYSYRLDKRSIQISIENALKTERKEIDNSFVIGWEEYVEGFLKCL